VDGRVSSKLVTVGNLINGGAGQATMLTTVESVDPIYCYVDVDENSVLKYQKLAAEKKRFSARDGPVRCFVRLSNEDGFPHVGIVDFVDNHVDPTTGTIRCRAVIPNTDGRLTPGYFASLRVTGSGRYPALLIPDTAIGNDQNRRTVMVLGADNKVEVHPIEIGALFGQLRAVTDGLKPDDKVIINGQMHARPGDVVAPTTAAIAVDPSAFADPDSSTTQPTPTTQSTATQPPSTQPTATQPAASATGTQE
jgi:RND family efflux transporter MFP subunit